MRYFPIGMASGRHVLFKKSLRLYTSGVAHLLAILAPDERDSKKDLLARRDSAGGLGSYCGNRSGKRTGGYHGVCSSSQYYHATATDKCTAEDMHPVDAVETTSQCQGVSFQHRYISRITECVDEISATRSSESHSDTGNNLATPTGSIPASFTAATRQT